MRRELEVMKVLRVPPLGKLVVAVDNVRYQSLSEVGDEKANRVLLAAIGELIDFAGGYQTLVEAGVASPLDIAPVKEAPLEQQREAFLARLEAERDAAKSAAKPQPAFATLDSAPTLTDEPPTASRELSVAEQIDAILQELVANDPAMAERVIRLVQDPSGGIRIEVDGKMYQKPGDIPEPSVQQLIKRAVKRWDAA